MKITMESSPEQILKLFRECKITESAKLETPKGVVYLVGGILSKTEGNKHFIAHRGRWLLV